MAQGAPATQEGDGARRCLFSSFLLSWENKAFTGLRLLSWIKPWLYFTKNIWILRFETCIV